MHFFLSQSRPSVFTPRDNHVTNGVGTSGCKPRRYDSWLDYYKQHAGEVNNCSVFRCTRTDLVGAHVLTRETHLFCIIPLCRGHNHPDQKMELRINENRYVVTVTEQVSDNAECQWQH